MTIVRLLHRSSASVQLNVNAAVGDFPKPSPVSRSRTASLFMFDKTMRRGQVAGVATAWRSAA